MSSKIVKLVTGALILMIISALLLTRPFFKKICCASEYKTRYSPNHNYYLKIYRYKPLYMIMPGSSGDAPGYIQLYNKNNLLIQEKEIEMVQMVNDIRWSKNQLDIKFIASWELTKPGV
ncbi:hypothetical protein MNBD_GAMMA10-3099 [hydrothermal vent metagenome]|uniref:Uncharacterized protein n=1 Tax=hydrothermal vent metagenome TaxID=652676 RepID=A0A3B0Y145_9ZZZZ